MVISSEDYILHVCTYAVYPRSATHVHHTAHSTVSSLQCTCVPHRQQDRTLFTEHLDIIDGRRFHAIINRYLHVAAIITIAIDVSTAFKIQHSHYSWLMQVGQIHRLSFGSEIIRLLFIA
jgi:hypothetical protein